MQFARDLDASLADQFVGMYVNERTLNYGEDGREAIRKLLEMGFDRASFRSGPRSISSADRFKRSAGRGPFWAAPMCYPFQGDRV